MPATRSRRTAEEARLEILQAAERRLIAGGPAAIRVQPLAHELGLTDPAVHHHFGSRQELIEELLRFAGDRLRTKIFAAINKWNSQDLNLRELANLLADTFERRSYARLMAWMVLSGWTPTGSGMYSPLIEAIRQARMARAHAVHAKESPSNDSSFIVVLLNLALWAEPLIGNAVLRAAGLPPNRASKKQFREWLVNLIEEHVKRGGKR